MVKVKSNVAFKFCNGTCEYWELLPNLKKVNSKTREFYNRMSYRYWKFFSIIYLKIYMIYDILFK